MTSESRVDHIRRLEDRACPWGRWQPLRWDGGGVKHCVLTTSSRQWNVLRYDVSLDLITAVAPRIVGVHGAKPVRVCQSDWVIQAVGEPIQGGWVARVSYQGILSCEPSDRGDIVACPH